MNNVYIIFLFARLMLTRICFIFLFTCNFTRPSVAAELSVETLLKAFELVVFRTEVGEGANGKPVVKWTEPITARLVGAEAKIYRKDIDAIFKQLSRLTGLSMTVVAPGSPSNMIIHFLPTVEIRRIMKQPRINCTGTFTGSKKDFLIRNAEIYISTDTTQKARHCIPEEIAQVMGLPNDTPLIADSIFNDDNTILLGLSLSDRILVRTLYDKTIRPGMSAKEARPFAHKIIDRLSKSLKSSHDELPLSFTKVAKRG